MYAPMHGHALTNRGNGLWGGEGGTRWHDWRAHWWERRWKGQKHSIQHMTDQTSLNLTMTQLKPVQLLNITICAKHLHKIKFHWTVQSILAYEHLLTSARVSVPPTWIPSAQGKWQRLYSPDSTTHKLTTATACPSLRTSAVWECSYVHRRTCTYATGFCASSLLHIIRYIVMLKTLSTLQCRASWGSHQFNVLETFPVLVQFRFWFSSDAKISVWWIHKKTFNGYYTYGHIWPHMLLADQSVSLHPCISLTSWT